MVISVILLYLKKLEWWNLCYAKHEEVDTRMIYYVGQLSSGENVVVRTVDTSVVVIALGCFHQLQDKRIWVESGIQSKNNLRYIKINQLFDQIGEQLCKALPFYHAFTGCNYTSSFNRKGKIKLINLLEPNPELQEAFLICRSLKMYLMTSNQPSSPFCFKCMEERRRTQSIKQI